MSGLPPIDTSGANLLELPVKTRPKLEEGPFLNPVPHNQCRHLFTGFTVDTDGGKCFCRACKGEVSPMFVLEQLMNQESRWMRTLATYQDAMKRLDEKSRCKCRHCGQMTRIER